MNTALTLRQLENSGEQKETRHDKTVTHVIPQNHDQRLRKATEGKNAQRLKLIFEQHADNTDVFELIGWEGLPDSIKDTIKPDLEAYRSELLGLYSACGEGVKNRRKRVSYWVKAYRDGYCSEQTAADALAGTYGL